MAKSFTRIIKIVVYTGLSFAAYFLLTAGSGVLVVVSIISAVTYNEWYALFLMAVPFWVAFFDILWKSCEDKILAAEDD